MNRRLWRGSLLGVAIFCFVGLLTWPGSAERPPSLSFTHSPPRDNSTRAISTLPVDLAFDGTGSGGIADGSGTDTGFTDVLASPGAACYDSTPSCDDPNNPGLLPYYIPGNLLVDPGGSGGAGTLTITTTDGDNVLGLDDLDNALSVELDASTAFVVQTRILLPVAPDIPNVKYEGGSIYWGYDASNYVKIAYAYNCDNIAGSCLGVQFASEIDGSWNGGSSATNPELPYPSFTSHLDLFLIADPGDPGNPDDNTATACYAIDGGAPITIATRSNIPDSFFASSGIFAGLTTTHTPYSPPNGGTPLDIAFEYFKLFRADQDDDGHMTEAVCGGDDCDDADPDVYPGATEECNGVDDDCDDDVDEDWNCDDVDACTTDYCSDGVCEHDAITCNDGVACTDDTCDLIAGCQYTENDALCPPGDICDAVLGCILEPECQSDPDCDDGEYCNGAETCVSNQCQPGTAVSCDDANDCTLDTCDEDNDNCSIAPLGSGTSCGDGDPCSGDETCDGAGTCQPGTPVDCSHLDDTCLEGVCDTGTGSCAQQDRPDGLTCADDGDHCDGEEICQTGSCVNDLGVSVVDLVPLNGVTALGGYRARDIANNDYAPRFFTAAADPDYTASDYSLADIAITYQRTGILFEGHLEASGLKPNFAYQVKLVGMPTREFGTAGDDLSNENIGYAGRWYRVGGGNANDAAYEACKNDPGCTDIYEGYLVFDFFITDRFGQATYDFLADQSLHVLFRDCPPERPLTGCGNPGGLPTLYQNVIAKGFTGWGYDQDYQTWNFGVYGQIERTPPQAYLADGEYRCRFLLTEESFHESGIGGNWASTVGEAGIHFWINQTAGLRDCEDWDLCNGYESCDVGGACQSGTPASCDDQDPCTDESCDAKTGCSYTNNSASCDDDDACTSDDGCSGGACSGTTISCDDSVDCTGDSCDTELGCQHTPNDTLCDAGETCDQILGCILGGGCFSDPECNDTQYCNGVEWCNLGNNTCQPGTAIDCDDGQFCNGAETCNETADSCDAGTPPDCTDGDGGTVDYCDPGTGACGHAPSFDPADGRITDSMWVSGMELGGVGVGKLEVRTNGEIGNFTINNNWDKWIERAKGTFFAVHVDNGGIKQNRILRRNYSGGAEYSGVDNVDHLRYLGMFPKLNIDYFDDLPVSLQLNAFSPLIPQNPADSSLPVTFFTFDVTNESANSVDVSLAMSWENILGRGGYDTWSNGSQTWNTINGNYQENVSLTNLQGVRFMTTQSWGDYQDNSVGEYLLLAETGAGLTVSTHNSWNVLDATPSFWSEFATEGTLTDPSSPPSGSDGSYQPAGTVAVKASLAPAETKQIRFMVVWFMPVHITAGDGIDNGHAYLNDPLTDTADEIAEQAHGNMTSTLAGTSEWQDLLLNSNLPFWLKLRMINGVFTMFANAVYPEDQNFYTHESLISMRGSLGTSDQRMCFHPFYTMLFPGLDQKELTVFGDVRPGDGRVSHFNGNVGWELHTSSVGYGVTNWPDLSCSYVMQVLKSYKWTGNMTFLDDNWAEVKEVMSWLQSADADGDYIPEGGSTYDYEGPNPGAFSYTASAYLGALKAAEELARIKGETTLADSYAARFGNSQSTVMTNLWTGTYFKKYYRVSDGATTTNSFIASLAGDWLSRYSTTGRTLDVDVTKSAENHILNYHQDLFPTVVAPMEVALDGNDPAGNCYQYQHEPYIGMQSIYDGYVDEGLDILYRIYEDHWEKAHWPWNGRIHPSVYGSGKTGGWNGNYYMSNPATWSVLNALSGSSIDVPGETLYLAPHLPAGWTELHMPIFFPKFWAWLDFDHATGRVDLEIVKTFGTPITISKTVAELASGTVDENTTEGLPFTASLGAILTYYGSDPDLLHPRGQHGPRRCRRPGRRLDGK